MALDEGDSAMATGNVVVFLGSPRQNGYSTALAREVARGAKDAGLAVKEYDLNDPGIRGCQGCYCCREQYGCSVKDYLAPMYRDIAEARAVVVASPVYFYQITGQAKVWLDRMFPMLGADFAPRQPGKKAVTVFSQHQDNPDMFRADRDRLGDILKGFGWELTASIASCGEPDMNSSAHQDQLKQAYDAGAAFAR